MIKLKRPCSELSSISTVSLIRRVRWACFRSSYNSAFFVTMAPGSSHSHGAVASYICWMRGRPWKPHLAERAKRHVLRVVKQCHFSGLDHSSTSMKNADTFYARNALRRISLRDTTLSKPNAPCVLLSGMHRQVTNAPSMHPKKICIFGRRVTLLRWIRLWQTS